jgi:hypothetical protein
MSLRCWWLERLAGGSSHDRLAPEGDRLGTQGFVVNEEFEETRNAHRNA